MEELTFKEFYSPMIGTFLGFLSAVLIAEYKSYRKLNAEKKTLLKNLKYELEYNINLYNGFVKEISTAMASLASGSKNTFLKLDYHFVGTHFAIEFYQKGLIVDYLHQEDMKRWNNMLNRIGRGEQDLILDKFDAWKQDQLEAASLHDYLLDEKKHLEYAKDMSEYLLKRL